MLISKVQDTLALSKTVARAMLLKMQWNDERLESKYFDDPDRTLMELINMTTENLMNPEMISDTFCCPVCYEDTT